ncbi:MAG: epoxyqueuosine reductase QueH [Oscillospiraceae bacterium]|nr:epoxyqueuosine reductase QueH [Oscillospiraceae bacterium]
MSLPKLLLHSCCAPCSSAVLERLLSNYDITLFFCNPNIHPLEEYNKRLDELKRFLAIAYDSPFRPRLIVPEYEPVIPVRCEECFLIRLEETAKYAKSHGFDCFTTTLTMGSKKKADTINPIAAALAGRYRLDVVLDDFKKKNGYNRSVELSKKYALYRQTYCGCI